MNLVTVIVPIYNVEKYLDDCISSIVNQTYKNLEIILVDDGSPDNCPQICDEWAKKDSRIKVIHKENGGVSSARNAGLDVTTGDYIGFVDSDDYIDLDMYESMLNEILENNADAASCGIVRESANGYKEHWGDEKLLIIETTELLKLVGEAHGINPVCIENKLYSKKSVGKCRFNTDFKYSEDHLFNFQVAQNIDRMVIHNVERYHYVNNPCSVMHRNFDKNRFDVHKVMDIIFSLANDEEVLKYCVKGDVLKSFRTIKEMCESKSCMNEFKNMRCRIISHRKDILKDNIYSKPTKLKTLFLWFFPNLYKIFIRNYAIINNKKYEKITV